MAIAATDLAEVLGTIIALKLLFGLPLLWGCLITAFDTFALLYLQRWGMRQMEAVILVLVATIGGCFLVQIFQAQPDDGGDDLGVAAEPAPGRPVRGDRHPRGHGDAPQPLPPLRPGADAADRHRRRQPERPPASYYLIDSAIALNAAFFVNAAILILSAAVFHRNGLEVATIQEAHKLLPSFLGKAAPILFAVALLCAGQSSTLTGTLAGQIVMEGYLHLQDRPLAAAADHAADRPDPRGAGDRA